jgi:hypothetical protein
MNTEKSRFKLELELEIGYVPNDKERRIDAAKKILHSTETFIRKYVDVWDERTKNGRMSPDVDLKSFIVKEI